MKAPLSLSFLVVVASVLDGQSRASRQIDSAYAQATAGRLDSAAALLRLVLDTAIPSKRRERARAICGTPEPAAVDFLAPDTTGVGSPVSVLTERPRVLSGPTLRYPEHLRRARIQGRVVVAGVIDTSGQAERGSVRVVESADPGFNSQATNYLERAKFRPGRIGTRPVRVCVEMPVDFRLRQ